MNTRVKAFHRTAAECERCPFHAQTKVYGEGPVTFAPEKSHLLIVGEAPGAEEDAAGRPFVGRAGQILNYMLKEILNIDRSFQYILNVIDCRPPKNNFKHPDTLTARQRCEGGLNQELSYAYNKGYRVMITLGNNANEALGLGVGIKSLRGRISERNGWVIGPTYHPSFIARKGGPHKGETWTEWEEDFKLALSCAYKEKGYEN